MFLSRGLAIALLFTGLLTSIPLLAEENLDDKPTVLASIKPLQLIAAAIAGDHADVELLLPVAVSPHLYQLKPSDRQRLATADQVIWLGPAMERFLAKPIALIDPARVVMLLADSENEGVHHHREDEHHHGDDPHIWINPIEAIGIAHKITKSLVKLAPQHQQAYQKNWRVFQARMQQIDKDISAKFNKTNLNPYMVLHDAYNHFENRYGIKRAAALSLSPDRKPGAKHLWKIKKQIDAGDIACVFREPQYQPAILKTLLRDTQLKILLLDPMATNTTISKKGYETFIKKFAKTFLQCN